MYMAPIFIIIEDRMKILLTVLFLMLATTVQAKDFSLIDQNGVQHQMSWYARTPNAKIILVSYDGNLELREKVEELQAQSTQTYYFFVLDVLNRVQRNIVNNFQNGLFLNSLSKNVESFFILKRHFPFVNK